PRCSRQASPWRGRGGGRRAVNLLLLHRAGMGLPAGSHSSRGLDFPCLGTGVGQRHALPGALNRPPRAAHRQGLIPARGAVAEGTRSPCGCGARERPRRRPERRGGRGPVAVVVATILRP
ncbi:Os03g0299050, partial [Oryza sativa Japonica Group]